MSLNTSPARTTIPRDDLLLESTIFYWWSRRWFIFRILAIAVVIFIFLLLLIPKSYRAQSSVIIMPPRFLSEVRTQPLTVTTAQRLLETPELYQQVIQKLRRTRDLVVKLAGDDNPEEKELSEIADMIPQEISSSASATPDEAEYLAEMSLSELHGILGFSEKELQEFTVDSLSEMLSSEESVEKKTASDLTYSPVLQLYAVADSGNKAQAVVNIWAKLFEQKYEQVTRGQTQRLFESLESQQTEGQKELENIQKVLVEFNLENNLTLLERQISEYTESMTSYSHHLVVRSNELLTMRAQMDTLVQLVTALEAENGGWLGEVQVDAVSTGTGVIAFGNLPELEGADVGSSVALMRREALRSRYDLLRALSIANQFQTTNPVEKMQAEEKRLQDEFLQQSTEFRQAKVKSEVFQNTLDEINKLLALTSQSLVLATALPQEVVGQALLENQSTSLRRATELQLQQEQLNPMWIELVNQRANVSRNLAEADAIVNELAAVLPQKETEVLEAGRRLFQAVQAEETVLRRVERYEEINQNLFTHYAQLKDQLFSVSWRVTLLEQDILSIRTGLAATRLELERLREEYEAASAQMEVLKLRKSAIEERASLLTQKLQESLVAVGEQVSDVTIAAKAIAPSRHFFPPRSILFIVLTLITTLLLLAGMSRRRYLQLAATREIAVD